MQFTYTAVSKEGKTVSGTTDAASKEGLISSLGKQGLHPILVKEYKSKLSIAGKLKFGQKVKQRDLVIFTRQLSTMISAGVPLARSLATLQDQSESKNLRLIIGDLTKEVESGAPLADAFAKHPSVFSPVYINMVKAGETGGILDEILKRLAAQVEQEASIRKKIKGAMTYPAVILSITVVAFFGIMFFIIPKIGKILLELGGADAQLPIYTRILLGVSAFLKSYIVFIVIIGGISVFLLIKYIRTEKGRYKYHSLLLRIPVIKTLITKIAIARFARTFASLMSAGVGVLDALEVTGRAIGNKVIEEELIEAAKQVKNGRQLSEPLSKSKHFPPIVAQMLSVGEETGKVDTILIKVADFYEEEVNVTIDGLSSLIEPIMIIVLGTFVGLIAVSVMGPIASLSQNVGSD